MSCPKCGSSDVRKATVYWQCLSCNSEWLLRDRPTGERAGEGWREVVAEIDRDRVAAGQTIRPWTDPSSGGEA